MYDCGTVSTGTLLSRRLRAVVVSFFFQAEDGIRDLVRSRGLGDVYKRQALGFALRRTPHGPVRAVVRLVGAGYAVPGAVIVVLSLIHI